MINLKKKLKFKEGDRVRIRRDHPHNTGVWEYLIVFDNKTNYFAGEEIVVSALNGLQKLISILNEVKQLKN